MQAKLQGAAPGAEGRAAAAPQPHAAMRPGQGVAQATQAANSRPSGQAAPQARLAPASPARPTPGAPAAAPRPGAAARPGAIQRKVGFELEVDLPLSRYVQGEEAPVNSWSQQTRERMLKQLTADMDGEFEGCERVRGHETVLDRWYTEGWKVTADNTKRLGTHKANLEIVTRPIDTERLSPTEILWQLDSVVGSMKSWVEGLVHQNPQHNRIRVGQYVIGFPRHGIPKPQKYKPGNVATNAYVQINVGVPMTKVTALYGEASRSGNEFHVTEKAAVAAAQRIFAALKKDRFCADEDKDRVVGMLTLLGAAVLGARTVPTNTLLKKLWTVLPKCGLHQWWRMERQKLSEDGKALFLDYRNISDFTDDLFCPGLKVKGGEPLLGQYSSKRLKEVAVDAESPVFNELDNYTVHAYVTDVLAGTKDLLLKAALQHKTTTGHGTSQLPLDEGRGQPLGVMEVRNLSAHWGIGEWRQRAEQWAKFAYNLTGRNWDQDLQREREHHEHLLRGAMESYEGSLAYRQHMSHFVPEI